MKTPDNNEIIIVSVGKRKFNTAIYDGVQRFMPHNETPPALAEKMAAWDKWIDSEESSGKIPEGMYTPNDLFVDQANGLYSKYEIMSYQTNAGFSVDGLADVSLFSRMKFTNPLWGN